MDHSGDPSSSAAAAQHAPPAFNKDLAMHNTDEAESNGPPPLPSTRRPSLLTGSNAGGGAAGAAGAAPSSAGSGGSSQPSSASVTPILGPLGPSAPSGPKPLRSTGSIYRTLAMPHTEAPALANTPKMFAHERNDSLAPPDAEHDKSDSATNGTANSTKSHPTPSAKFVRQLQLSTTNAQLEAMARENAEAQQQGAKGASADPTQTGARSDSLSAPNSGAGSGLSDSGSAPPPSSAEPALRPHLSQIDSSAEVLDWSGKGLRAAGVEGGWSLYPRIHTLILRDNELSTLLKQGIDSLPNLRTLDLRRNRLSGFGDTLLVLSQCRALKHVYLHQSTRDNVTNNISLYTDFVFQSLRGLESCDGVPSKLTISLNPLDQSAFDFIHMLSGGTISENALLRCDLSNKNLPARLFFFLLSALHQLKVAWLKLDGNNEWANLNSYTNCVIYYLGKYLLYLDEEEITNQRLHLALKAQAESKIKIIKIGWEECYDEALEVGREYVESLAIAEEEAREKERIARHMRALERGEDVSEFGIPLSSADEDGMLIPAGGVAGGGALSDDAALGGGDRRQSLPDGDYMPLTAAEQRILDDAAAGGDDGTGNGNGKSTAAGGSGGGGGGGGKKNDKEKDEATGFNLHIPGRGLGAGPMPGGQTAATANSVSTHNSNVGIDTQLSHKLEILIHYLQVYGLVLLSSIHIDTPQAWDDFSEWVRLFTLNIDQWFNFLPFQQNILFWTVSFFPFLLLFLFWRISRLRGNLNQWIDSYITNWTRTKKQVGLVVGTFVILGVACALLFMGNPVYKGGVQPNNANYTAALSFFVFPLLFVFIWWIAIRKFRRGWAADQSSDKDQFRSDWLSKINFWQWLCLFLITNTFMPVARVILKQFQCTCDGQGVLNTVEDDATLCYSTIDSSKHCFPTHVALTQIVAMVCGCLYIVGIPIFYYILITKTVTLVLSTSRQYKLLTLEIKRMEALPKALRHSEQVKKDLREYKRIQFKLYYNVVNNPLNSVPASSLFAAYQERYKFTKLWQMLEKIMLVVVVLFVPDSLGTLEQGGQIVWASAIIISYLLLLLFLRPYNDPLDDSMDIIAEAGNTTSILVALSLAYKASWLSLRDANILLFVANGVILFSFIMAFIISPLKTYWRRKKRRLAAEKEKSMEEHQIASIMDGVQAIKQRRASQAQLLAGDTDKLRGDKASPDLPSSAEPPEAAETGSAVHKPAPLLVTDDTNALKSPEVVFGTVEEAEAAGASVDAKVGAAPAAPTHIVRIHGEEDGSDSENEGSPDPEATRSAHTRATIDEALVLGAAAEGLESPEREDDHLQVRTLSSPLVPAGPLSKEDATALDSGAAPRAFTAGSPPATSTPAGGAASALSAVRSPYSHVAARGYEPHGVETALEVQTSAAGEGEGQDQVPPLGSGPRSSGRQYSARDAHSLMAGAAAAGGRKGSFSATLGAPLSGGSAAGSRVGSGARRRHIAQPSIHTLEALFRATSPPPLAAGISAPAEDQTFPLDGEADGALPGNRRAASASFLTLGRAISFTAVRQPGAGTAVGSAASSPAAAAAGAAASPAASSSVLFSPEGSTSGGALSGAARDGHARDNLSIDLEADFERQFERTGSEMARLHQLSLLKLCTPSSSEYASQLAMDSTRSLPGSTKHNNFNTYAPLPPASGSLAAGARNQGASSATGAAGSTPDGSAFTRLGYSANPAAAAYGRTLSANTLSMLPTALAHHSHHQHPSGFATLGAPLKPRPAGGRDPLAALRAKQAGERAAAAAASRPASSAAAAPAPAPLTKQPSVSHIDVSISQDAVAPVVVTPRAAAVLARLEQSESAQEHAADLARVASLSSGRPPAAAASPHSVHNPPPAHLAASLPPRPAMSHFQPPAPAAAAAASPASAAVGAEAVSPHSKAPKSSLLTSILESEGMLPQVAVVASPEGSRLHVMSRNFQAPARSPQSHQEDDIEMQRVTKDS